MHGFFETSRHLRPRKKKTLLLLVVNLLLVASRLAIAEPGDKPVLRFCIDHYPANQIFPNELEPSHPWYGKFDKPFGYAIESMRELSQSLDMSLELSINTPFKRCLAMMKQGTTDLMWGLLRNPEREKYMHLFEYTVSSPKIFLLPKDSTKELHSYRDLKGLSIAVVRGFKYFPEFDKEKTAFKKYEINSIEQGLNLLALKRVDTFIMRESNVDDFLNPMNKVSSKLRLAEYRHDQSLPVYIGLSRNSDAAKHKGALSAKIADFRASGRFQKIREDFNRWFYIEEVGHIH